MKSHLLLLGLCALAGTALFAADNKNTNELPISRITLFSSGVGYFQRDGNVSGRSEVHLNFPEQNINDLLKSMVVQDFGKQPASVTYESRDPISRTLKTFGVDLDSNPSFGALLTQLRGELVQIQLPQPLKGTIVSVEKRTQILPENRTVEAEYLNLLTREGLRSVPLSQIQQLQLQNTHLNDEFQQALAVLATGHDKQKKSVAITFDGEGERAVRVAYVLESPVWKTSYRLVLTDKEKPYLQGWAIVENTTDEDWNGIHLSLISGRPISFTMNLYDPLYAKRPNVQLELYSSLTPATYGDALEKQVEIRRANGALEALDVLAAPSAPQQQGRELQQRTAGFGRLKDARAGGFGGGSLGDTFAFFDKGAALAEGAATGELFEYAIANTIDLPRHKSAMLPIVSTTLEGDKLSIYAERTHAKHPLNGFRLKNTTDLSLMQGPITVFDSGAYAGDAKMEDLPAHQDRLISYGLDLKTEIDPRFGGSTQQLVSVSLNKGTLRATSVAREEKIYTIRNRDTRAKTVLIEHPLRTEWKLIQPKDAPERTRDTYRFKVSAGAQETATFNVEEERSIFENIIVSSVNDDVIGAYLRSNKLSSKVRAALQKILELRHELATVRNERTQKEQRIAEISQEQGRIRENMARLAQNSELYQRYVKKFDQQESELEEIGEQVAKLKAAENAQSRKLSEYIDDLDV